MTSSKAPTGQGKGRVARAKNTAAAPVTPKTRQAVRERGNGQGYQPHNATRNAVERHAVRVAVDQYQDAGWDVVDLSAKRLPYDLVMSRDGVEKHVEVKGTTSDGADVIVTSREVEHARSFCPHVALFVVVGITVSEGVATGGTVRVCDPWSPGGAALRPSEYRYRLPDTPALPLEKGEGSASRR